MFNWKLCILCQSAKDKKLVNPMQNTRKNVRCSFNILAEKITRFYENGVTLPVSVSIENLKKDSDIESNLRKHEAQWHKSCSDELNSGRFGTSFEAKIK